MKKKVLLLLVIALIAGGAIIMSYGADMVIDGIGLVAILIGCIVSTVYTVKNKDKGTKKIWILSFMCTCLAVIMFGIAGIIHFTGSIILALLGAVLLCIASIIEYKRL